MGMVTAVANGSVTVTATSDGVSGLAAVVVSQEFIVNSADDVDDGTCDASHCSLREVLRVANAFNSGGGVIVRSGTGNAILSNFIFSNGALGIGLIDRVEVTPNDLGDDDTGANDVQNFPVLTSAVTGGSSITIEGGLNSTGSTGFRLEFFANAACDPSGNGEGETFLGSTMVTTDDSGDAGFTATFSATVAVGQLITATATDPNNNTSEFSQCVSVA